MIIKQTKIPLLLTNEELEYGLGFMMDYGKVNTYWGNYKKERSFRKDYLGYKTGEGEFYLEEKRMSRHSNAFYIGYRLRNVSEQYVEVKVVVKWKNLLLHLAALIAFIIIQITLGHLHLMILKIWAILMPLIFGAIVLNSILCYRSLIKDLKETVGKRVRIREYHRMNPR